MAMNAISRAIRHIWFTGVPPSGGRSLSEGESLGQRALGLSLRPAHHDDRDVIRLLGISREITHGLEDALQHFTGGPAAHRLRHGRQTLLAEHLGLRLRV